MSKKHVHQIQNSNQLNKKPELLAPAGNIESFYTAIESGADAVYLGLDKFNARLRARNFTPSLAKSAISWAHRKNKKVYITLNTLIKERELKDAVHILAMCESLSADALIIADWGLINICRKHFPGLILHASTQAGVHNSAGTDAVKTLGIKRTILARELSFQEIAEIRQHTKKPEHAMELEVFVHGALCYSFSGSCLASSFLGGKSGNRGLCTQVCRRPFSKAKGFGVFFSPLDFQAIDLIPELCSIGIDSFKIEGRMKNPGYIATVVSAYRKALDFPDKIPELKKQLKEDFGRPKTRFFLNNSDDPILGGKTAGTAGLFIGTVSDKTADTISVSLSTSAQIENGDWIRILPKTGFEGQRVRVKQTKLKAAAYEIELGPDIKCLVGDEIYLADRSRTITLPAELSGFQKTKHIHINKNTDTILLRSTNRQAVRAATKSRLVLSGDCLEWFRYLDKIQNNGIIISLNKNEIDEFLLFLKTRANTQQIYFAFPYFISEPDISFWKAAANKMTEHGVAGFVMNNIGHLPLLPKHAAKIAGPFLNAINSKSRAALLQYGFRNTIYSLEDDFLNIRNGHDCTGWVTLFAHVPLFTSRINPGFEDNTQLVDQNRKTFFTVKRNSLYMLCGASPLCLFSRREKLQQLGNNTFIIDFSYTKPDSKYADKIVTAYYEQLKIPESTLFNFKAELA